MLEVYCFHITVIATQWYRISSLGLLLLTIFNRLKINQIPTGQAYENSPMTIVWLGLKCVIYLRPQPCWTNESKLNFFKLSIGLMRKPHGILEGSVSQHRDINFPKIIFVNVTMFRNTCVAWAESNAQHDLTSVLQSNEWETKNYKSCLFRPLEQYIGSYYSDGFWTSASHSSICRHTRDVRMYVMQIFANFSSPT